MTGTSTPAHAGGVAAQVAASVRLLPERYIRGRVRSGISHTYHLKVGPGSGWVVVVDPDRCTIWPRGGQPVDAVIRLDPRSWLDLMDGRVSGLELFFRGRLEVDGDLNEALRMDTLFHRPPGSPWEAWHPEVRDVTVELDMVGGRRSAVTLEAYVVGPTSAPPIVFIHGLGASKVSLLPLMAGVASTNRVIALDLPGFGHSDAPLDAPYTPVWLAEAVRAALDKMDVGPAVLVGNSLGGRTAVEIALADPAAVAGLVLLCPAVGFKEYRPIRRLLRATRPDAPLAAIPWLTNLPVARAITGLLLRSLFADPDRVPEQNLEAARDEALRILRRGRNRYALLAVARQIGMADDRDFWRRLAGLSPPSLWIFGDQDVLVSPAYARPVAQILPAAEVEVWQSTGHVPQFEHRQRTADRLLTFMAAYEFGA